MDLFAKLKASKRLYHLLAAKIEQWRKFEAITREMAENNMERIKKQLIYYIPYTDAMDESAQNA